MDEVEFLEAMPSFETIDKGCRALREKDKERERRLQRSTFLRKEEPIPKIQAPRVSVQRTLVSEEKEEEKRIFSRIPRIQMENTGYITRMSACQRKSQKEKEGS